MVLCRAMSCRVVIPRIRILAVKNSSTKTREKKRSPAKVVTCQQGQSWGSYHAVTAISLHSELLCCCFFFVAPTTTARGAEQSVCVLITIVIMFIQLDVDGQVASNSRRTALSLRLPRSLSPPLFRSTWQRSAAEDCAITPDSGVRTPAKLPRM